MNGAKYPRLLTLVAVVVSVAALYFAKVVLVPLAISALLAFLLSPLVSRMHKLGLPRIPAIIVVLVLSLAFAGGVGWVVGGQLNDIANNLPAYEANLTEKYAVVRTGVQSRLDKATKTVTDITQQAAESRPDGRPEIQQVTLSNRDSAARWRHGAGELGRELSWAPSESSSCSSC